MEHSGLKSNEIDWVSPLLLAAKARPMFNFCVFVCGWHQPSARFELSFWNIVVIGQMWRDCRCFFVVCHCGITLFGNEIGCIFGLYIAPFFPHQRTSFTSFDVVARIWWLVFFPQILFPEAKRAFSGRCDYSTMCHLIFHGSES